MCIPSFINRIAFPIKDSNLIPCNKFFCVCIEYLDFGKKEHVSIYKHCMVTSMNNKKYPSPRKINKSY